MHAFRICVWNLYFILYMNQKVKNIFFKFLIKKKETTSQYYTAIIQVQ